MESLKMAHLLNGSTVSYNACSSNCSRKDKTYPENFHFIGIGTIYSINNVVQTTLNDAECTKLYGFWRRNF